ncbi:MAG: DUF5661 family protein, partial [Planctomycetota bacterium]
SKIEYKSDSGKFFTEGYLEVAGDVDISGDVCTENCIDSIISQCLGTEMKAVTLTTVTRKALKMSADHAHLVGGDRREMPVGKIVDAKKVIEGGKAKAWIKTEINQNHPEYKSIIGCIEEGYFDSYSIEYIPTDYRIDGKNRILNDMKVTGAAYTGRPILSSATMTDFYAKSITFEQLKSMMDMKSAYAEEDIQEGLKVEQEHKDTVGGNQEIMRNIAIDHLKEDKDYYKKLAKMEGNKCSGEESDTMETKEEKKSEIPITAKTEEIKSEPKKEEVKSEVKTVVELAKSELFTKEQVKAMIQEEMKAMDLKTFEEIKSAMAEEIKKNAEEIKSKVLVVKEEKKSAAKETIFDEIAKNQGWVKK